MQTFRNIISQEKLHISDEALQKIVDSWYFWSNYFPDIAKSISSDGDVRNAINTLQFFAIGTKFSVHNQQLQLQPIAFTSTQNSSASKSKQDKKTSESSSKTKGKKQKTKSTPREKIITDG